MQTWEKLQNLYQDAGGPVHSGPVGPELCSGTWSRYENMCVHAMSLLQHRRQHSRGGERWNKGQVMRDELDHTVFYFLKIESLGFEGTVVVKLNFICQ